MSIYVAIPLLVLVIVLSLAMAWVLSDEPDNQRHIEIHPKLRAVLNHGSTVFLLIAVLAAWALVIVSVRALF